MTDSIEKRVFPRIDAQCPVLYRVGDDTPWKVARMENMSATGIKIIANEDLPTPLEINIHIKPGSKKSIPEIKAIGVVIRSESCNDGEYIISCKLTAVAPS